MEIRKLSSLARVNIGKPNSVYFALRITISFSYELRSSRIGL